MKRILLLLLLATLPSLKSATHRLAPEITAFSTCLIRKHAHIPHGKVRTVFASILESLRFKTDKIPESQCLQCAQAFISFSNQVIAIARENPRHRIGVCSLGDDKEEEALLKASLPISNAAYETLLKIIRGSLPLPTQYIVAFIHQVHEMKKRHNCLLLPDDITNIILNDVVKDWQQLLQRKENMLTLSRTRYKKMAWTPIHEADIKLLSERK